MPESASFAQPEDPSVLVAGFNIHAFTLQELRVITQNFSSANLIGEGESGTVYKGLIDDRLRPGLNAQPVAVKLLDRSRSPHQRLTKGILLGQLRHPNLVKLIGYCCEDEKHRALVYEYMAGGTLDNHLFTSNEKIYGGQIKKRLMRRSMGDGGSTSNVICLNKGNSGSLPWSTRMKIALGIAKGLAFLHESEKLVVFYDFKGSKILLDSNGQDYNVKLSNFEFPEYFPVNHARPFKFAHGYAAPEYCLTGYLTTASNTYSFGVVLLELLTGRKAVDMRRPAQEQILAHWAYPNLKDHRKLQQIIDPRLKGMYSEQESRAVALLASDCLTGQPKSRPTMNVVVATLESLKDCNEVSIARVGANAQRCIIM